MSLMVVLAFAMAIAIEFGLPILSAIVVSRRLKSPWGAFLWGIASYFMVQILQSAVLLSAQETYFKGGATTSLYSTVDLAGFAIILGLVVGIFEEVGRFLIIKYIAEKLKKTINRPYALMFGIGWAGLETIAAGAVITVLMLSYMSATEMSAERLDAMNASMQGRLTSADYRMIVENNRNLIQTSPTDLIASPFERAVGFILQIAWTLLVYQAVKSGSMRPLYVAIIGHVFVESSAALFALIGGVVAAETFLLASAILAGYFVIGQLRKPVGADEVIIAEKPKKKRHGG